MKSNIAQTALLLFARTANEEVQYKHLLPGQSLKKQKALFQVLNTQAENLLKSTELPYFIFNARHQQGNTFGARLYAAIAEVFSRGFQNVIVIGNDCPALLPVHIQKAANCLSTQDVVLGPTDKGGIYLLGLTNRIFGKIKSLDEIRWQTAAVVEDLNFFFAEKKVSVFFLRQHTDVNQPTDLKKVVNAKSAQPALRKLYFSSLSNKKPLCIGSLQFCLTLPSISHLVFRGPPVTVL